MKIEKHVKHGGCHGGCHGGSHGVSHGGNHGEVMEGVEAVGDVMEVIGENVQVVITENVRAMGYTCNIRAMMHHMII